MPKQLRAVRIVLHKTKILTQRRREAYEAISFNSINRFQIWIQYVGSCTLLATGNSYYDLQIYGQVAIRWTADLPNPTESTGEVNLAVAIQSSNQLLLKKLALPIIDHKYYLLCQSQASRSFLPQMMPVISSS